MKESSPLLGLVNKWKIYTGVYSTMSILIPMEGQMTELYLGFSKKTGRLMAHSTIKTWPK